MTNVVLFMTDEHNPRYCSVHGHPFVQTPNLGRLAERGAVWENAYCNSPLCVPSRSSFMSGRYAHEIDRYNNCKVIEGRYPSYGQVLADQGVHTAYIGSAANLYRDPHHLGFSEMIDVQATHRSFSTRAIRDGTPRPQPAKTDAAHGSEPDRFAADITYVDDALDWLHRAAALDRPWTVTINVHPPHPPYTADPAYWELYRDHADLPEHRSDQPSAQHPYAQDLRAYGGWAYDDDLVRDLRRGYYGMITYVDAELGRVLTALDDEGLTDDTVVIYLTDHGEMLGKFGIWGKMTMFEDAVRVPIVAAGPGFAAGTRVRTPISLLDVQAAIFRAVGADRPDGWHGEPLQDQPVDDPERVVFSEYHGPGARGSAFMIRQGEWKLIYNTAAPHQLFNLAEDPDELTDLTSARAEKLADLERELRRICNPEEIDRRATEFSRRQLQSIARLRARRGSGATGTPWLELARSD